MISSTYPNLHSHSLLVRWGIAVYPSIPYDAKRPARPGREGEGEGERVPSGAEGAGGGRDVLLKWREVVLGGGARVGALGDVWGSVVAGGGCKLCGGCGLRSSRETEALVLGSNRGAVQFH